MGGRTTRFHCCRVGRGGGGGHAARGVSGWEYVRPSPARRSVGARAARGRGREGHGAQLPPLAQRSPGGGAAVPQYAGRESNNNDGA